jgi:hypothetical protein
MTLKYFCLRWLDFKKHCVIRALRKLCELLAHCTSRCQSRMTMVTRPAESHFLRS